MFPFLTFSRYYCFEVHLNNSPLIRGQVRGAIDPVTLAMVGELNATVPLWGRAKISLMSGNLKDGIDLSINAFVARGTFGLRLSGKDMRSLVDLDVKSAGKIKDDIKLLTLPYVSLL